MDHLDSAPNLSLLSPLLTPEVRIVTLSGSVHSDPVLIAYSVKRTAKGRAVWTRIGSAYPHETGAGLTVLLDAIPTDGRIILLELDDDDDARLGREVRRGRAKRSP